MRYWRIMALMAALAVLVTGSPALATGIIGSISGVNDGDDVLDADQGARVAAEDAVGEASQPGEDGQPGGEGQPGEDGQPGADAAPTAEPVYQMNPQAQALYERIAGEAPHQEGWQMQCVGDSVLVLLDMPELTVWNIEPESNLMELMWCRDLTKTLSEDEGNPLTAVSPDGSHAVLAASDGSVYLVDAIDDKLVAKLDAEPERLVWARDSQSFACITGAEIRVYTLAGGAFVMEGEVVTPVANESEWLNPAATPAALSELLASDEWRYAGTGEECVLFNSAKGDVSCAYIMDLDAVVTYPELVHSTMLIGKSGACPVYDASTESYALYLSDGAYANVPVLSQISEGGMANPYGWLGDSICVLVQDASSRSSFRLLAANTSTGITYTLLTPWEYAQTVNGQAAPTPAAGD